MDALDSRPLSDILSSDSESIRTNVGSLRRRGLDDQEPQHLKL